MRLGEKLLRATLKLFYSISPFPLFFYRPFCVCFYRLFFTPRGAGTAIFNTSSAPPPRPTRPYEMRGVYQLHKLAPNTKRKIVYHVVTSRELSTVSVAACAL
jgi:hypothetical protein